MFVKNTYKIFSIVILTVLFFVFYNIYVVDRSIVNLRVALSRATAAGDFEKIKAFLKIPILREISKITTSSKNLIYMEMIDNLASLKATPEQLEELKFYLGAILDSKEKERGRLLSILDGLNSRLIGPQVELSEQELKAKEKSLVSRIGTTRDKNLRQRLYYELGNVYLQLSDVSAAQKAYLEASQIDPKTRVAQKARFNIAWAYKALKEYDKSSKYFEELIQEFPDTELAILSQYQIADIFYKKGEYQKAVEKYAEVAKQHPDFEATDLALFQAGYISFYNLNDKEAALGYFSKLEETFSKAKITKHTQTKTRLNMAKGYCVKGYRLIKDKKYLEAMESFEKGLEIAPLEGRAIVGIGIVLYYLGEKDGAVEKAKKAAEVSPNDEATLINAMFICANSGKLDDAINMGEAVFSRNLVPKKPEFYFGLAYANLLKANLDQAIRLLNRTIKINPDFVFAYNNSGCVLWAASKYNEAIRRFQQAVTMDPKYVDAHFNLGVAFFYINRLEDAYKEFKSVLFVSPDYAKAKPYLQRITDALKYEP